MVTPDPRERDLVKCEDMRLHAQRAVRFLGSQSLEQFLADELIQMAVIRCVEVIGYELTGKSRINGFCVQT